MNEHFTEGNEDIGEGAVKLLLAEINRFAQGVAKPGEWGDDDAYMVLRALAKNGLRGKSLEDAITNGVDARAGARGVAGQVYAHDKQGFLAPLKRRSDLPDQAQQDRA